MLSTGVVRGWRWTFWLILVAFLAGLLRVPASALQLTGNLPAQGPTWYVVLQAVVGLTPVRHRVGDARRLPQGGRMGCDLIALKATFL